MSSGSSTHQNIKNWISTTSEVLLACRLISLEKNLEVRPIGLGEILRGNAGKVVITATCNDIIISVGVLQVCTRHVAGGEVVVHHSMDSLYNESKWKQCY